MSVTRVTLLLFITLALSGPGCGNRTPPAAPAAQPAEAVLAFDAAALETMGVQVAEVTIGTRSPQTEAPARIALDEHRTARIGSLVEGRVLDKMSEVGDRVARGQVLTMVQSTLIHDAWADYRKAVAERRRLETELSFAETIAARNRRLYADKAISRHELQRAEVDRSGAASLLEVANTEVRRCEEELEHLGISDPSDDSTAGSHVKVFTPIAGAVIERHVTEGSAVTAGTPLYVISDLRTVWALIDVDESLVSRLREGQPVELRVLAYPGDSFTGTILHVSDTVNPVTRRVTLRCAVNNAGGRLKPNMYATAVIRDRDASPSIVVPEGAVQNVDGRPTVFVAESGGRFLPRVVDAGAVIDGMVEVRSGLAKGERIAVAGSFVLKSELLKATGPED